MPSSGDSTNEDPEPLLLCWSEGPIHCEQEVEVIKASASEAVVSSPRQPPANADVSLVARHGSEQGTVESCQEHGAEFLVTIRFSLRHRAARADDRDPGVLALDNFLTEEQEMEILRQLEEELRSDHP